MTGIMATVTIPVKGHDYPNWIMTTDKTEQPTTLGGLIYNRRYELGRARGKELSRAEVARRLDVDPSTVSNWESGKRRDVASRLLNPLAQFLGLSLPELVDVLSTPTSPAEPVGVPVGSAGAGGRAKRRARQQQGAEEAKQEFPKKRRRRKGDRGRKQA